MDLLAAKRKRMAVKRTPAKQLLGAEWSRCVVAALASASIIGCSTSPSSGEAPEIGVADDGLSSAEKAVYDQCLQDNMAVAMAWEAIQQNCRKLALGELDDPLKIK